MYPSLRSDLSPWTFHSLPLVDVSQTIRLLRLLSFSRVLDPIIKVRFERIASMFPLTSADWPLDSHKGSQEDLVRDIDEFAGLIAHMTDAEAKNDVITDNVFLAITYVKLFVATWHSGEAQQHAVHAIKACEDKAVNKGLRRWVLFFKPPQNLGKFFDGLELRFKKGWKAMDSLVDVFCATEATAKV
ncbi:hypothetical protein H0H93_016735 [Arthromyces matolae]|nr:hypothetical protein H0H93_016735 [Arthromyces matolae]